MFIEQFGSGSRAFVGFHGWTGSHQTYAPLVPHLPPDVTLYAADLPGYGRSPHPSEWNFEVIIPEITDALMKTVPPRFTLIGNCSGAIMALMTCPRVLDRLDRLILIDPFAFMPWYFRVFLSGNWGWYAYASTFANPVGRWITNTALRSKRTENTDLTDSFATIDHRVTYGYLRLFAAIESIEAFDGLTLPIDIAYGERTFGAIKQSLPAWRALWPHARSHEMKGAGHLPILEATGQVARMIFEET